MSKAENLFHEYEHKDGFLHLPTRPVEATITLSITFLCVEVYHAREGRFGLPHRYPWLIALSLGLLHGLGFAGAHSEIGLPKSEIPIALLFFNIGVEIGQIIFVGLILLVIWLIKLIQLNRVKWAENLPIYLIGTTATYWFFERLDKIVLQV